MKRLLIALCLGLLLAGVAWGAACPTSKINRKGTSGQAITVGSTAVVVADANTSRCSLFIDNVSVNDMRCRSKGEGDPTSTAGKLVSAGEALSLDDEGKEQWKCIRTGGSDATAEVIEGLP